MVRLIRSGLIWAMLAFAGTTVAGGPVAANPWPREDGAWFIAPELGADRGGGRQHLRWQVYAEHGLATGVVLGGHVAQDGGWHDRLRDSAAQLGQDLASGSVFLRLHPGALGSSQPVGGGWSLPWSVELGLRMDTIGPGDKHSLRAQGKLHLGGDFSLAGLDGWTRLSLAGAPGNGRAPGLAALATEVGLNLGDNALVMLGTVGERTGGTVIRRTTLQGGYRLSQGRTLVLAATRTTGDWREKGLRLGFWQEF